MLPEYRQGCLHYQEEKKRAASGQYDIVRLEKRGELKRWSIFLIFLNAEDGDQVNDNSAEDRFVGRKWTLPWGIYGEMSWKAKGYYGEEGVGEGHGEGVGE